MHSFVLSINCWVVNELGMCVSVYWWLLTTCRVDQRGVRSDAELKELMYELMEQEEVRKAGLGCTCKAGVGRKVWGGGGTAVE